MHTTYSKMEQHDTIVNYKYPLYSVSPQPKAAEMFPDSNHIYKRDLKSRVHSQL